MLYSFALHMLLLCFVLLAFFSIRKLSHLLALSEYCTSAEQVALVSFDFCFVVATLYSFVVLGHVGLVGLHFSAFAKGCSH